MTAPPAAGTLDRGAVRFARFAFAPNERGLCGPDSGTSLFEHARDEVADGELRAIAAGFEAAWPWLSLLAEANGRPDPLDPDVVDAYWIGSPLAWSVPAGRVDDHLRAEFTPRLRRASPADRQMRRLPGDLPVHHSSHVLRVMPLIGLVRSGLRSDLLDVMTRCLVRPGRVLSVDPGGLTVEARGLTTGPDGLTLGPPRVERVASQIGGRGFVDGVGPGDLVAIHWDWAADRLTPLEARSLIGTTRRNLAAAPLP